MPTRWRRLPSRAMACRAAPSSNGTAGESSGGLVKRARSISKVDGFAGIGQTHGFANSRRNLAGALHRKHLLGHRFQERGMIERMDLERPIAAAIGDVADDADDRDAIEQRLAQPG